jgi:(S)-ureidoglycine aminohydrolase
MGIPTELLTTRAIIKHNNFVLIPPEGRVNNSVPNLAKCNTSILCSPKLGASFAFYTVDVLPNGGTTTPFCQEGIETFVFCISGKGIVEVEGKKYEIGKNGYVFAPASEAVLLKNNSEEPWKLLLYKQRYRPLEGYKASVVVNNLDDVPEFDIGNVLNIKDDCAQVRDLLPSNDLGFDVNFHTLRFKVNGKHPFVETHVQEHGMYFLQGMGMYLLDDIWVPTKKDDFIWFGAYTPQGFYTVGDEEVIYIYSKDTNRDVEL